MSLHSTMVFFCFTVFITVVFCTVPKMSFCPRFAMYFLTGSLLFYSQRIIGSLLWLLFCLCFMCILGVCGGSAWRFYHYLYSHKYEMKPTYKALCKHYCKVFLCVVPSHVGFSHMYIIAHWWDDCHSYYFHQ